MRFAPSKLHREGWVSDRNCTSKGTGPLQVLRPSVGTVLSLSPFRKRNGFRSALAVHPERHRSSPRLISTGRLNALPHLHPRPINLVIYKESYQVNPVGDLILGPVSHLDAFSVYPLRTWLPSRATGVTTGTPEVRPPRSSRTKGRTPQISYARGR